MQITANATDPSTSSDLPTQASSRARVTVTCDMLADLAYAASGPRFTPEYEDAERAGYDDDFAEMERLDAAQDDLAATAGNAWKAAAERIGAEMGYEVEAILTQDQSVRWTQTGCAGETVEQAIWQAAHDAIAVDEDDGVWTVEAR